MLRTIKFCINSWAVKSRILKSLLLITMVGFFSAAKAESPYPVEPKHIWFSDSTKSRPAILEFYQSVHELTGARMQHLAKYHEVHNDQLEAKLQPTIKLIRSQWELLSDKAKGDRDLQNIFNFVLGDLYIIRPSDELHSRILGKDWVFQYHNAVRESELLGFYERWLSIKHLRAPKHAPLRLSDVPAAHRDELLEDYKAARIYEEFGKGLIKLFEEEHVPAAIATGETDQ